jgi:hypothetical protein
MIEQSEDDFAREIDKVLHKHKDIIREILRRELEEEHYDPCEEEQPAKG